MRGVRAGSQVVLIAGTISLIGLYAPDAQRALPSAIPQSHASGTPALPPPPPDGEQGFVVNHFWTTAEGNDDDCPDGYATMLRENLLATLPAAERDRITRPENEKEFKTLYRNFAVRDDGSDICTNMERFDHPAQKTVQGKVAAGFNLDGDATGAGVPGGCAHDNFIGRNGEAGVDNQFWRAMGCMVKFRNADGKPPQTSRHFGMSLANGENAQVIVLRGVDSWERDDDVEIIYANTPDRAIVDAQGAFLHDVSYSAANTPGGPNRFRGRIANGTIEARVPHLVLRQVYYLGSGITGEDITGTRTTWEFRDVRLKLTLRPDGSLAGMLGGYQPVSNALIATQLGGAGAALSADYDCASMYAAVVEMADGHRDPETGQCTTISTSMEIAAVPAFVTLD